MKIYSAGIYARLSVDLDDKKSETIENQILLAREFADKAKDIDVFGCYTDVGKSGADFMRAGFERMMSDVSDKKINCIIVKDLSRLGRNHIETGNYLEKIFPCMGVRFISLNDGLDTAHAYNSGKQLDVELKNLMNEMYAKDISVKVKSAKAARKEGGEYVGGNAPYGFRAVYESERRVLKPDAASAEIVKKIYELFLSNCSIKEIALYLNKQNIASPSEYFRTKKLFRQNCQIGQNREKNQIGQISQIGQSGRGGAGWNAAAVKRILKNPAYSSDFKGFNGQNNNKNDKNRHCLVTKPIISYEIFSEAQKILEKNKRFTRSEYRGGRSGAAQAFGGLSPLVYCFDRENKNNYIAVPALYEIVIKAAICGLAAAYGCSQTSQCEAEKELARIRSACGKKIKFLEGRAQELRMAAGRLYLRYKTDGISREFYEKQAGEKLSKADELEKQRDKILIIIEATDTFKDFESGRQIEHKHAFGDINTKFTGKTAQIFIKRIELRRHRHIIVYLSFKRE